MASIHNKRPAAPPAVPSDAQRACSAVACRSAHERRLPLRCPPKAHADEPSREHVGFPPLAPPLVGAYGQPDARLATHARGKQAQQPRRESGAQPQVSPEEEQLIRTAVQQEWAACVGTQLDELRTQVEAARRQMQSRYEKLAAEAGSSMEAKYTKLLMKCEALRLTSQKAAAAAARRLDELEPRVAGYAATRKAQAREDEKRALLRELRRRARTRWRSRGLSGCHAAVGFLQRVANQAAPCDAVLQKCRCEAERLQAQRAVKQYLRAVERLQLLRRIASQPSDAPRRGRPATARPRARRAAPSCGPSCARTRAAALEQRSQRLDS